MSASEESVAESRPNRKVRVGYVVSDKMDKTVAVRIDRRTTHPLYRKTVTRSRKYLAHDDSGEVRTGDLVRIAETRPLSKTKKWRVVEVVEKAK